jgi:hypothetical protein
MAHSQKIISTKARLVALAVFVFIGTLTVARSQPLGLRDEFCESIADQRLRAQCNATIRAPGIAANAFRTELPNGWRLIRTASAGRGTDIFSITRAADSLESDLNLAGILLQCAAGPFDALIVVIQPYPPHSSINVALKVDDAPWVSYLGSVIPPGVLIRLPAEAMASLLPLGWRAEELNVQLAYGKESETKGVVRLAGLAKATEALRSICGPP